MPMTSRSELRYWACYTRYETMFDALSDAELGRLLRALLRYAKTGEEPKRMGREETVFRVIAADIDKTKSHIQRAGSFDTEEFFATALRRRA